MPNGASILLTSFLSFSVGKELKTIMSWVPMVSFGVELKPIREDAKPVHDVDFY